MPPQSLSRYSLHHKQIGALAQAIENLKHGSTADLTREERDSYHAYHRQQQAIRWEVRTPEQRARHHKQRQG